MILARDVIRVLDQFAPPRLAMPNDVIGLQIGTLDKPVQRIWLALDPYPAVLEEAIANHADLLITHHALLFRPAHRIDTGTVRGRAIAAALGNNLTVYNAHTNLDIADGGVNDVLADLFGLTDVEVLDPIHTERLFKLVVFTPQSHQSAVWDAVCSAGAGHIGQYSHCTFAMDGVGTFRPLTGAKPFIGNVDEVERVQEVRMETIVPEPMLEHVINAMLQAHPYEEVAYDVYPLQRSGKSYGIGRIGNLPTNISLTEFAELAKQRLKLRHIRFGGTENHPVKRVAVLGGAGGRWAFQALAKGADVLLTADCDHHAVAEAWQDGLAIVDATHAALERPVITKVGNVLQAAFGEELEIVESTLVEDPFTWV